MIMILATVIECRYKMEKKNMREGFLLYWRRRLTRMTRVTRMRGVTRMMSPDSVWREHSTKTLARIGEDKLRDTIN